MKNLLISAFLSAGLISLNAFADAGGEVCHGAGESGANFSITVSKDAKEININADGKRVTFSVHPTSDTSDVSYAYEAYNGDLRVTFWDEDSSVSGWSADLGVFKGTCKGGN